jgi:hypothetical protein
MPMRTFPPAWADASGIASRTAAARSHTRFPIIEDPPLDQTRVARPPLGSERETIALYPLNKNVRFTPELLKFHLLRHRTGERIHVR